METIDRKNLKDQTAGTAWNSVPPGQGGFPADAMGAEPPGNLTSSILHGLRRRWLVVFVLGAICAGGAGAGVYFLAKDDFTAVSTIRISLKPEQLLFANPGSAQGNPEVFKATQRQMVYLPVVLERAMAEVGTLSILQEQSPDQLQWLRSVLKVSFRDESEYMDISLTSTNDNEAKRLVDAIALAFFNMASEEQRNRQNDRDRILNNSLLDLKDEIKQKYQQLSTLEGVLQNGDSAELTLDQKFALDQLSQVEDMIFKLKIEIRNLKLDQAAAQQAAEARAEGNAEDNDILSPGLELALATDPKMLRLEALIKSSEEKIEGYKTLYSEERAREFIEFENRQIEKCRKKLAEQREVVIKDFELRVRAAGQSGGSGLAVADPDRLERQLKDLEAQRVELRDQIPGLSENKPAVDVLLLRAEITQFESTADALGLAIQQNKVENGTAKAGEGATERISKPQPAILLRNADRSRKYIKCGVAGGFGWGFVGAIVVWWDMRKRRINNPNEIVQQLGMPVIGALPLLKRGRRGNATGGRLAEAVDGIAAALLCGKDGTRRQIVQISSASPGEGKSTLAANLATSLAASGRNTLLIDFDLRRPVLHKVYDVELGPGVSEILMGTSHLHEAIQPTTNDNLMLLSAGHWRQKGLGALTDSRIEQLFQECRERFEFIIVDTSPVLPVVDGRLVSRHVDGVIISLLRDVSEVPKVAAACQMLESFGAPIMGGVMIGSSQDVYYAYPYGQMKTA